MKILRSEWMKTKRTPVRWLAFLMPVLLAGVLIGYYSLRPLTPDIQLNIFVTFFELWTAFVIPMGAGLIPGIMVHQEELAGNFNGFLGSKMPRRKLYHGKLIMIILVALTSTMLAALALTAGVSFVLRLSPSWPIFLIAALMATLGTLPLLAFHLWISFAWGMGASIGIGGGGILIAALMATSLGDNIWPFVPWAWPVRLSELAGAFLLNRPGMNLTTKNISFGTIVGQSLKGLIPSAVLFAGLLIGGLAWFKKWEGRKAAD